MKEIMKIGGGNGYKLPHMNKQRLEREGRLPYWLSCENGLYAIVLAHLAQFG